MTLRTAADAIQVRCPDRPASEAGFFHGVAYGSGFGGITAGASDLGGAYFGGTGSARTYELTGAGSPGAEANWTRTTAPNGGGTAPASVGVVDAGVIAWLESATLACCGSFEPPVVVQKHGYRYGFNGKENDNEWHGATGTLQDYGMRAYDTRVARFFAVDPLHASFPWLSPYQFASNTPIAANDVDGLEANLALYGQGSDEAAFKQRAIKNAVRSTNHMEVHGIMSGDAFIERLQTATNSEGTIANFIFHSHAGAGGLFLRSASGFYSSWGSRTYGGNITEANMDDLMGAVESGSIRFEDNAVAVFLGCNVGGYTDAQSNYMESLASEFTRRTGVTSIASVGEVFPEIIDGKETGMSKSAGGFYRLDQAEDGSLNRTFLGNKINALDYMVDATPKRMETRKPDLGTGDSEKAPLSR